MHPKARVIHKGINPEVDSYSAFFDNAKMGKTSLEEIIKDEEVADLYICGIATDVCVGELGPMRIRRRGKPFLALKRLDLSHLQKNSFPVSMPSK